MLAHRSHNRMLGRLVHWGALDQRGGGGRGALCQPFHLPYSNEDYGYKVELITFVTIIAN